MEFHDDDTHTHAGVRQRMVQALRHYRAHTSDFLFIFFGLAKSFAWMGSRSS